VFVFGTHATHHGKDESLYLLRLYLGLGEELGMAETKLRHLGVGELMARVDNQGHTAKSMLLAKPLDKGESISVGELEVEDDQVRAMSYAMPNSLLPCGGMIDVDGGIAEVRDQHAG
jgi:hypothetical protein